MFYNRREIGCMCYGGVDFNGYEYSCGEPSCAVWNWGYGDFYVCEKHDLVIQEGEEVLADDRE